MTEQKLYQYLQEFEEKIRKLDTEIGRFLGLTKVIDYAKIELEREDERRYLLKIILIMRLGDKEELLLSHLKGVEKTIQEVIGEENVSMCIRFTAEADSDEDEEFCDVIKKVDIVAEIRKIVLIPK